VSLLVENITELVKQNEGTTLSIHMRISPPL
jgi:hypothetical protein